MTDEEIFLELIKNIRFLEIRTSSRERLIILGDDEDELFRINGFSNNVFYTRKVGYFVSDKSFLKEMLEKHLGLTGINKVKRNYKFSHEPNTDLEGR